MSLSSQFFAAYAAELRRGVLVDAADKLEI
jgi:hypothetical protein